MHYGDQPLVLPNAWDFATAAALVDAGFPAIGTTSLAVAAAHGVPDEAGATLDESLAAEQLTTRSAVGGPLHRDAAECTARRYATDVSRAAFRKHIIGRYLVRENPRREGRSAIITAGAPGSGKSLMRRAWVADLASSVGRAWRHAGSLRRAVAELARRCSDNWAQMAKELMHCHENLNSDPQPAE
jgi:hypothetical protein